MLGWFSAASALASRSKRITASDWLETLAWRSLIATFRWILTFSPSYTAPMPPVPSSRTMRYLSSRMVPVAGFI